jgi:cell division protein FtsA
MTSEPVVALEIGTTKVVALVGEGREGGNVVITGIGEVPSTGVRKGEVIDLENAVVSVRSALTMAEETAKVAVRQVHLAVSGTHIQSRTSRGSVPVQDREAGVTDADIRKAMAIARSVQIAPERDILHSLTQYYCLDGQERVLRPEGMEGALLGVDMLILHGLRNRVKNSMRVVESLLLDVRETVFSGLCSAISVVTPEQRRAGVIVLDIGGGTTEYAAYAGDVLVALGAIAVGGDHITNDIALGLTIPPGRAEQLKREVASAVPRPDQAGRKISVPAEVGFAGRDLSVRSLDTIVSARVDELLRIVRKRLEGQVSMYQIGAGVLLTGGSARLAGMQQAAEAVFGVPAMVGRPCGVSGLAAVTEGPEYATATGLVQYALQYGGGEEEGGGAWLSGLIGGILRRRL